MAASVLVTGLAAAGCGSGGNQRPAVKQAILGSAPRMRGVSTHILDIAVHGSSATAHVRLSAPQVGLSRVVPLRLRRVAGRWRIVGRHEVTIIR